MSPSDFLKKQWPNILTVVITFLTLIMIFKIVGVNFTPVQDKHIEKVVTIESFDTDPSQDVIAENHHHNPKPLHDTCTTHSARACKTSSFCVLLDGEKCVGGDKHGPTYLTQDGDKVDFNYYHHKNTCHGMCGNN